MMRCEPRCEASGGKRRFSADGAEASREQQQIMVFSYRFHVLVPICWFHIFRIGEQKRKLS